MEGGYLTNDEADRLTAILSGKTIESVELIDGLDMFFVLKFTDKTELRLLYDWIYEWKVAKSD